MAGRIAVVGAGYVGLTTAACLAMLGHRVICADVDEAKVERLSRGHVDIVEPRLPEIVRQGLTSGRLRFVRAGAVADAEVIFLCLPTPMGVDGQANMTCFDNVALEVRDTLPNGSVLVIKSTVPVGTAARVAALLRQSDIGVVSNPEFLREGFAVDDFLKPDRIVIGSDRADTAQRVAALYDSLAAPTLFTDTASAELVKYAANGFLAAKLSFVNEVAELCERLGADIAAVTEGMGYDPRIGDSYLRPGPGWGGSCLPKDTAAALYMSKQIGLELPLLQAIVRSNAEQKSRVVDRVRAAAGGALNGKRIGLLGLTFKAGTNDLRDSPALDVADQLASEGCELAAYDPAVPGDVPGVTDGITVVPDAYQAVKDADVVVLLTEWSTFRALDWARVADLMAGRNVIDTRNLLDANLLIESGLLHSGIGIRTPLQ
ncbi:UDP-glucose 6-dehydrogenase [Mycobacterium sp. IS-836]|nr:UDP-glucose 6-dehydrogenase [Mycobacterium sp. IS-836]